MQKRAMAIAIAFVWLATALSVFHPHFRELGAYYLQLSGFPVGSMYLACIMELGLGVWILVAPPGRIQTAVQMVGIVGFTLILSIADPSLLIHPLGVLTKNLPLLCLIVAYFLACRDGWTRKAVITLRLGMAIIWLTEGVFPKMLFQQAWELDLAARWVGANHAATCLFLLGLIQAASAFAVLMLKGGARRVLLMAQLVFLVGMTAYISMVEPIWWVHAFAPLAKGLPIALGLLLLVGLDSRTSSA